MKVICISGKAQMGKDTTANLIKEYLEANGKYVLITHYADLLKYICKQFFGWDGKKDENGRKLLQYVGTDVIRNKRPDFWADFIGFILTTFNGKWDYVLIPDTRFPNEIEWLRDIDLDVIHVNVRRDGFESCLTSEQKGHISENAMDGITPDFEINNPGTMPELREIVKHFVEENL